MDITFNYDELSCEDKQFFLSFITFRGFYTLITKFLDKDKEIPSDDLYLKSELSLLQDHGFIKIISDKNDFIFLEKGESLFGKKLDSLSELADKLIQIFPQGIKSGGYPVRGSKVDVTDKLRKFFKKHKYTHDQVIQATQKYVDRKREDNWAYMQRLVYFIEKDNTSNLAAEIDGMKGDAYGTGEDWTRTIK